MGAVINHNSVALEGCHIDSNAVVMSGTLVVARTYVGPGEIVHRQAEKLTIGKDGYITKEASGSYPQYDKDAAWVKRYIAENGWEPSFF